MLLTESNNNKAARNNKIFLFEGNGSKAAKRTKEVIAKFLNKSVDDPEVIETEHYFKREAFGEGAKKDWFVPIEPIACEWWLKDGRDDGKIKNAIGNLVSKAGRVNDRLGFMNQIKALKNMKEVRHFVAKCNKEDRRIARESGVDVTTKNDNYDVSGPLSFDEAHTYYPKTGGNGASCPICYCQYRDTWLGPNYSNNDKNKLYILFRKDWEKYNTEKAVHDGSQANNGLGSPYNELSAYDDYGLSLILVWITPDGDLYKSNTRWNHGGDFITPNVDKAFTVEAIEKLMGAKFSDIFNVESILNKFDVAEERVQNGENPEDVFDKVEDSPIEELSLVTYLNRRNFLDKKNNNIVLDEWFIGGTSQINNYGDLEFGIGNGEPRRFLDADTFEDLFEKEYYEKLNERLASGVSPFELFEEVRELTGDVYLVKLFRRYNLVSSKYRKMISDDYWFDTISRINRYGDFFIRNNRTGRSMYADTNAFEVLSEDEYMSRLNERLTPDADAGDLFTEVLEEIGENLYLVEIAGWYNVYSQRNEKRLILPKCYKRYDRYNDYGDLLFIDSPPRKEMVFFDSYSLKCFDDEKQFIWSILGRINNGEFHYDNGAGDYEFDANRAFKKLFKRYDYLNNICIIYSVKDSERFILDLNNLTLIDGRFRYVYFVNKHGDMTADKIISDNGYEKAKHVCIDADSLEVVDNYEELMINRICSGKYSAEELGAKLYNITDKLSCLSIPKERVFEHYILLSDDLSVVSKARDVFVMNKFGDVCIGGDNIILGDTFETINYKNIINIYNERLEKGIDINKLFNFNAKYNNNFSIVHETVYGNYNIYSKNSNRLVSDIWLRNINYINELQDIAIPYKIEGYDEHFPGFMVKESEEIIRIKGYHNLLRERLASGASPETVFTKCISLGRDAFLVGIEEAYKNGNKIAYNILLPNGDYAMEVFCPIDVRVFDNSPSKGMKAICIQSNSGKQYNNIINVNGNLVVPTYDINKWPKDYYCFNDETKGEGVCVIESQENRLNFLLENGDIIFGGPIEAWPVIDYKKIGWQHIFAFHLTGTNGKENVLLTKTGKLLYDSPSVTDWFDNVYCDNSFSKNIVDEEGNLVRDINGYYMSETLVLSVVRYLGKYNVYENEKLLWDYPEEYWFDKIECGSPDYDGIHVWIKGLENRLMSDGTLLWKHNPDEWFDEMVYKPIIPDYSQHNIRTNLWVCKKNKKYCILKNNGTILGGDNALFDNIRLSEENYFYGTIDGTEYILDLNGNLTEHEDMIDGGDINFKINQQLANNVDPKEIFEQVYAHDDYGNAAVYIKGLGFNIITPENKLLTNRWFRGIHYPDNYGNYTVDLNSANGYTVQSIMKPDGTFLWNHPKGKWFMALEPMIGGPKNLYIALICYVDNGQPSRNLIDENGNFVLSENAKYIDRFRNGFARIRNNDGSKYYLDTSFRPHEPTQELDELYEIRPDRRPARRA